MTPENIQRLLRAVAELLHTHADDIDTAIDDAVDRKGEVSMTFQKAGEPKPKDA
jgi:hypothetical protein